MDVHRCLRNMGQWSSLLLGLGLLTSCSSEPLTQDYVAPVTPCCARISEFQFRPLPPGEEFLFNITPTDSTYRFSSGGAQHFAAFRIPDGFTATAIQTKSYLSSDYLPKATALLPDFIFFDSGYRQLGRASVRGLQERGDFWGGSLGSTVAVPPGTRYLVVVAGEGDGSNYYHSENGRRHPIPAAALGRLSLRLFGEVAERNAGTK